jgi:hypothetical protein
MIKKPYFLLIAILFFGVGSCNLADEAIPDVQTILAKTFQIKIFSNSGISAEQIVDISSSAEYNDFKNILDGYDLIKITYQVKNDNIPEDMYLTGEVICKNEEGNQQVTVGSITRVKISDVAEQATENDVNENFTDINKVLGWLENPGRFKLSSSYTLTDVQNSPYPIISTVSGSNFELIIRFYLKVKTSV